MVAHRSRAVGGALQGEIVDDHRLLVGREVHVQLDAVGALLERQLEGGDGVLGRVGRGAAVADHEEGAPPLRALSVSGGAWHYRAVRTPVIDVARPVIRLGARIYFRIRFEGIQHIPRSGPLLIVPNHVTFADPVLATIPVRRPVHYMAWNALFRVRGLAWLIRRLRAFPVDLDAADAGATRDAVRLLRAGEAVMIFPEAGRSLDGRGSSASASARSGWPARSACPSCPSPSSARTSRWPPGRRLPRPGRLTIIYHPVIAPPEGADAKGAARDLAHRVHVGGRGRAARAPAPRTRRATTPA